MNYICTETKTVKIREIDMRWGWVKRQIQSATKCLLNQVFYFFNQVFYCFHKSAVSDSKFMPIHFNFKV